MELILYTIELLALSYYRRMYYEQEYRLIPPKTLRKRSCVAMAIAFVACIVIFLI